MMFKRLLALVLVLATNLAIANPALEKAIKSDHRSESSARDVYRNPLDTLKFFQVEPNHKVFEVSPGGSGWYTEILAPYLRDSGKLVLGHFDPNSDRDFFVRNHKKLVDKMSLNPEIYDQVEIGIFQAPTKYDFGEMGSYDRILTFRNVHNWTRNGEEEMAKIFSMFFDALKPGGKLGVIDHRLPESRDKDYAGGYVKESYVTALAEAAGFKLEGTSEINANAKDTADYDKGVWTLLPSLRGGEEFRAIGESDRLTMLFVKPE